jgi:hypothetical protein
MKKNLLGNLWTWLRRPSWREPLLQRFAGRDLLSRRQLYESSWASRRLPENKVNEALDLIEFEYQVHAGLLRAADPLDLLTNPPETRRPFRWVYYQSVFGDRSAELSLQLHKRLKRHGTRKQWPRVMTVDEYIRAWCGATPDDRYEHGVASEPKAQALSRGV